MADRAPQDCPPGRPRDLHERSDASAAVLLGVGLALAASVAIVMLVLSAVIPPGQPLAASDLDRAHRETLHWRDGARLLAQRRKLAEHRTTRLEWVDRERGIAAIPIEEAMRLIAGAAVPAHGEDEP